MRGGSVFVAILSAAILGSASLAAQTHSYPAHWWTPVPEAGKPGWEILPQAAKPGEVILSKRNELGILSNFAATPFTMNGKRYASVEGFWQMMLYPENDSDPRTRAKDIHWRHTRDEVSQMTSFEAKKAGNLGEENMRKLRIDWVTFEGKRIIYRSAVEGEHYQLIREAMLAKLNQNAKVREVLLSTGDLILRPDHFGEKDEPPEWRYYEIWMEIRADLQRTVSLDFFDEPKFTVAGVTEHAYVGGHGSDAVARSSEELSKETNSLKTPTASARSPETSEQLQTLKKAAASDPNNASLHHSIAVREEQLGDPLSAVNEFERAAKLESSEDNLFDWGTELLIHNAPQPAAEVYRKGAALFPLSSRMLLGSAAAFYAHGDYNQAAQYFLKATDLNPADPAPYLFLAKGQRPEIIDSDEYRARFARFVKLHPENAWANYYYAACLWNGQKDPHDRETIARVQALVEQALHLDAKLAPAYLLQGALYQERLQMPEAIASYQKAVQADRQSEQAHYRLAQAYRQTGQTQLAQTEIATFARLSRTSSQDFNRRLSELQRFVISLKTQSSN